MHARQAIPIHTDHHGTPLDRPVNIPGLNLIRDADGFYENVPIPKADDGVKNRRGNRGGRVEHRKRVREARRAAQAGNSYGAGAEPRFVMASNVRTTLTTVAATPPPRRVGARCK